MNLDDHIKDIFNHPPEFEFNEAAWERMEERLEETPLATPAGIPLLFWQILGVVGLAFLPALFVGGYYQSQLNQLQDSLIQVQQQQQSLINHTTVSAEQQLECETIYIYDTVYHTVSLYPTAQAAIATSTFSNTTATSPASFIQDYPMFTSPAISMLKQATTLSLWCQKMTKNAAAASSPTVLKPAENIASLAYLERLALKELFYNKKKENILALVDDLVQNKKSTEDYSPFLLRLQPDGLVLGATHSWVNPILDADQTSGYTTGIQGEFKYGRHLRLVAGVELLRLRYKLLNDATSIGNYPVVHPENPQDVFNYMKADMKYLQIPIGIKYVFNPGRILSPHTSLGIVARRPLKQHLDYEFLGLMREYYIDRSFKQGTFTNNTVWANLGVTYQHPNSKWGLSLEGFYNHDFRKNAYEFEQLKYVSFKTRLFYTF